MTWKNTGHANNRSRPPKSQYAFFNLLNKPVEIYVFIDPLCPRCWSMEPFLKKLVIEYGRFFKLRPIISGDLSRLNLNQVQEPKKLAETWEKTATCTGMSCDGDLWLENPVSSPWLAFLAIKAAELQGRKAGMTFLRKLQEFLFLDKQNISDVNVLTKCAEEADLDVEEFKRDLHSNSAKQALWCDLQITREMEVEHIPTIVLFNQLDDNEGLKITGLYTYDVYVEVLQEVLQKKPRPASKPSLEEFLKHYHFVASKEISVVYDWSLEKTEKEMKKMVLKQKAERVPVKYGTFWRYIDQGQ